MSVLYKLGAEETWWVDAPRPWICEECAEVIELPAVYWQGRRTLFWHPACAEHLGPQLIADAREATLAADPGRHWRNRLIKAVRHRLLVEELVA